MASHNNNSSGYISTSHNINNLEGFYANWSNIMIKMYLIVIINLKLL